MREIELKFIIVDAYAMSAMSIDVDYAESNCDANVENIDSNGGSYAIVSR